MNKKLIKAVSSVILITVLCTTNNLTYASLVDIETQTDLQGNEVDSAKALADAYRQGLEDATKIIHELGEIHKNKDKYESKSAFTDAISDKLSKEKKNYRDKYIQDKNERGEPFSAYCTNLKEADIFANVMIASARCKSNK